MKDLIQTMRLLVYFTSFTVCFSRYLKKKKTLKTTSQLVIFRALFFSSHPHSKSEKNPVNPLIKKSGLRLNPASSATETS